MERKDSGSPVICDFQMWEDSQDPQHKLLLKTCQLQVSCLNAECYPVFHLRTIRKGWNFSNFYVLICVKFRNIPATFLHITSNVNRSALLYDEASSWQSKRLKLCVMSLKKFVYVSPKDFLHFNLSIFGVFLIYIFPVFGMGFLIFQSKPGNRFLCCMWHVY